jgi:hypothetical protein
MADSTSKPSWLSIANAIGTIAVILLGVWFSDGETPTPPVPSPIVNPLPPEPTPSPVVETPSVNYVIGPDGTVLDDGSVGHFSAVSKQAQGSYEFHRIQSKKPVSITRITVGNGLPTPPFPPKPEPPLPPAPVFDTFIADVKNAYQADAPYNSVALDQLIKGYAAAIIAIDDRSNDSIGKLYSAVNIAVRNAAGGESLPNTRTALAKEADKLLPRSGTLSDEIRTKIKTQFERAKRALEACK